MRDTFSRKSKLRTDSEFKKVFLAKRRVSADLCDLLYRPNNLTHPRLGVIVSKKNIRCANMRNNFKRIAREYFRLKQKQIKMLDIVILAKSKAREANNKELRECLEKLFLRSNIQIEKS